MVIEDCEIPAKNLLGNPARASGGYGRVDAKIGILLSPRALRERVWTKRFYTKKESARERSTSFEAIQLCSRRRDKNLKRLLADVIAVTEGQRLEITKEASSQIARLGNSQCSA
jgi:hypothetical protein